MGFLEGVDSPLEVEVMIWEGSQRRGHFEDHHEGIWPRK